MIVLTMPSLGCPPASGRCSATRRRGRPLGGAACWLAAALAAPIAADAQPGVRQGPAAPGSRDAAGSAAAAPSPGARSFDQGRGSSATDFPLSTPGRSLRPGFKPWERPAQQLPTGLQGCCPVTLRERQRWAPGDPRFAAAFDGRQYTFASPREREAFLANPGRYVPALNGACLVTFHDEQRLEPGEFDCGLIHGGRLLFFAGEERRARFRSDPDRYANADLAVRGRCLVSLLEQRRDMPGDPRTATHFGGRRFLFVNAHGRSKFLADPASYLNDPRLAGVDPTLRLSAAVAATDSEEQGDERASADSAGERPQFAMQGYCPVSIRDEARWVRGRFDVLVTLGDLTFRCASTEHRERFAGDVARYVPALGGYCPVRFTDDGDLEPGSIYHSVELPEYDLLFMFAGADEMAAFKADPGRYAKADVAAGGACVVTQKKEGRSTPGSPRYSAWHEGLRYYFASAAYAEQFAAEPAAYAAEK